jgi:hypothetical protein
MIKLINTYKLFFNVLMRIVAAFTASALGVIGAGAIAHISTVKAMSVAGITAVASVVEKLARGFMDDGKLSMDEINAAFASIDTGAKTAADLAVEARQNGEAIVINADGSKTVASAIPTQTTAVPAVDSTPAAAAPAVDATPTAPAAVDPNYN